VNFCKSELNIFSHCIWQCVECNRLLYNCGISKMPTFAGTQLHAQTKVKTNDGLKQTFRYMDLQLLLYSANNYLSINSQFIMNATRLKTSVCRFQKDSFRSFPLVQVRRWRIPAYFSLSTDWPTVGITRYMQIATTRHMGKVNHRAKTRIQSESTSVQLAQFTCQT